MEKRKIGLALGSGAARGLAHIGVLDVLQKEGIPIDMVAGTSAGAMIGGLYALGKDIEEIKSLALELKGQKLVLLVDPSFPKSGFIKGRRIKRLLSLYFGGDIKIEEMRLPFACVATDVETGEEVVIDHGPVLEAIRASISIPGIFSVARWKGRHLVDGALVNPIPVDVLARMGADFIIAVNVIPEVSQEARRFDREQKNAFAEIRIVQQVSGLVQRLVKETKGNLEQPKIIREVSELVQKFVEEGANSVRNPGIIQEVSAEVKRITRQQTAVLGTQKIIQGVSGRVQQLAKAQRDTLGEPNIIHVLMQSFNISAYSLVRSSLKYADIIIEPQVGHIGIGDFIKGRECMEQGKLAASDVVPEIKRLLEIE
ncbi:patatin-like phospholipase family protein [Chloroflexota bacterium]